MVDIIPIELDVHKSQLIDLNEEYLSCIADEIKRRYVIDIEFLLGVSIREYAKKFLEELPSYLPTGGIYYIIEINSSLIGMGH